MSLKNIIEEKFGINVMPGKKGRCPFCGKNTFQVKPDDTIGKCFHPDCGRYILAGEAPSCTYFKILDDFKSTCLAELFGPVHLAREYLEKERGLNIFPLRRVPIGVIPAQYYGKNREEIERRRADIREQIKNPQKREEYLTGINKFLNIINDLDGWLVFFYTDKWGRVYSIKFRKPFTKEFRYFKEGKYAGVFNVYDSETSSQLLVVEGEFNGLKLLDIYLRCGESPDFSICAVGGVFNADFATIKSLGKEVVICYDNDSSGAGWKLVENAQDYFCLEAFTTPEEDTDLDAYLKGFSDPAEALEGFKGLFATRKFYPRRLDKVKEQIDSLRADPQKYFKKKITPSFKINQEIAKKCLKELSARGVFYKSNQGVYYFDRADCQLVEVYADEPKLVSLLGQMGLNPSEQVFKFVFEEVKRFGYENGIESQIYLYTHYCPERNCLYINNFDGTFYRISPNSIDRLPNGEEGVLFLKCNGEPVEYIPSVPFQEDLLHSYLISLLNPEEDHLLPDELRALFHLWLLSFFLFDAFQTHPIVALIGEKGSGKTTISRLVGKLLFGDKFEASPLPDKETDFDALVSHRPLAVLDNVDERCRWLCNRLASISTGEVITKRKLYTTNQLIEIPNKCQLIITSRSPFFNRDDVADRLLLIRLKRFDRFLPEKQILSNLLAHRNEIMSQIFLTLQQVLRVFQHSSSFNINFRLAEFAEFCLKILEQAGYLEQGKRIFEKLSSAQELFALERNPLMDLLEEWINKDGSVGRIMNASALFEELKEIAEKKRIRWRCSSPRSLAQKIVNLRTNLEEAFGLEIRKERNRNVYRFWRKSDEE